MYGGNKLLSKYLKDLIEQRNNLQQAIAEKVRMSHIDVGNDMNIKQIENQIDRLDAKISEMLKKTEREGT